jgi:hypothetical protein
VRVVLRQGLVDPLSGNLPWEESCPAKRRASWNAAEARGCERPLPAESSSEAAKWMRFPKMSGRLQNQPTASCTTSPGQLAPCNTDFATLPSSIRLQLPRHGFP